MLPENIDKNDNIESTNLREMGWIVGIGDCFSDRSIYDNLLLTKRFTNCST